jgi:hypothetical protein
VDKKLRKWEITGALATIIFGTILHFVYGWSGGNTAVGIFGAVNESTWEHLKLLFWPALVFSIVEYFAAGKAYKNFLPSKAFSVLVGLVFIVVFFYTYKGIIGKDILFMDILDFALGALISYFLSCRIITSGRLQSRGAAAAGIILLIALIVCFIIFTFIPPHIALFQDPLTLKYSIPK